MAKISIQTTRTVVPMIYAYTTPGVSYHDGWTKIGYTEQDVTARIKQQTHTAGIKWELQWKKNALFDDGSGRSFRDSDFHAYLQKQGVPRETGTEWFQISGSDSKRMINDFREDCGVLKTIGTVAYELRSEQEQAVAQTFDYFQSHQNGEFLWNAKPRFGKTLATYDLCKRLQATKGDYACNILIVTNRPAIANSWYEDFVKFIGTESGFRFVSEVSALKGKPYVMTREEYIASLMQERLNCIEFVSLQDLKGSLYFGGQYDKLKELVNMKWELLVIDEAHEGVDTSKTDVAFHQIKRSHTLHLSGTPFKALANDKFPSDAIYNWTYADEQKAKASWDDAERNNPYENLPQLNLFTYQMSEIIREELQQGIEIDGETEEYAFDLNLFFSTKSGKFVYESSCNRPVETL